MIGDGGWSAQLDQARQGLRDMAGLVHAYYCDLVGQGFTPEQALELSARLQSSFYHGNGGDE